MSRPNCITPIPKGIQIALLILILLALLANFSEPVFCEQSKGIPLPAPIPASLPLEITGLSTQKIELLKNGEALIRQLDTASKLSLAPFSAEASAILKEIAQLNPNYLVEVIALVPYTPGAKQIERLAITLSDIQGYIGIPYYSVREKKTYDLFDKVNILLRKTIPGGELIEAEQHMKPFEDYKASYEYRISADSLIFRSVNLSHIAYKGIRSVAPGNMKWYLYVFHSDGFLVYYGIGAVKAFDMVGLIRDRLEVSFIGRVGAFFDYMSTQLRE
jgi:hypothetical protein